MLARDKHSSLLRRFVNYGRKFFYNIVNRTAFEPIEEDIFIQGRTLLEADQAEDDFESYKLARDHYKACTDEGPMLQNFYGRHKRDNYHS
jgi:hypothetical protein